VTKQVKIIPFEPYHLLLLDLQEEQEYFFDFVTCANDIVNYGNMLKEGAAESQEHTKCAWTGYLNERVIGCSGIADVGGHTGEAWALLGKDFKHCARPFVKEIKRQANISKKERIYALVDEDHKMAERFIQWIGLEYEGTMKRSGTNKQNQKIYAKVREV
jgi:RimJ/RimL family protein N-acetyltransferase